MARNTCTCYPGRLTGLLRSKGSRMRLGIAHEQIGGTLLTGQHDPCSPLPPLVSGALGGVYIGTTWLKGPQSSLTHSPCRLLTFSGLQGGCRRRLRVEPPHGMSPGLGPDNAAPAGGSVLVAGRAPQRVATTSLARTIASWSPRIGGYAYAATCGESCGLVPPSFPSPTTTTPGTSRRLWRTRL